MELFLASLGFMIASYSIVGNDAIQTLGTFISSNEKRPWWVLWLFASSILALVLCYGWWAHNGDVAYGRLDRIPVPEVIQWWHIAPLFVLFVLTRLGVPVSTTFLVLSVFTPGVLLGQIIIKSLVGYGVAFFSAILLWAIISKRIEKIFFNTPSTKKRWVVAQWLTTAFLWSQWLIQDLANIFVYLPRQLDATTLAIALAVMISMLAIVFRRQGGHIQNIVKTKANTQDIRSATLINALYALVLLFFKELNNLPMSTTWVFLGVLAGREYAINHRLELFSFRTTFINTSKDLSKATAGLVVSILVALFIKEIAYSEKDSEPKTPPAAEQTATPGTNSQLERFHGRFSE